MKIDEMKGLSNKGKILLKKLRLERLVDENYLRRLYKKHKDFFSRTDGKPTLSKLLEGTVIGGEVLTDLIRLWPDAKKPLNDIYVSEISPRANLMAASQAIILYIVYRMKNLQNCPINQTKVNK